METRRPAQLPPLQTVHDRLHVRVLASGFLRIDRTWNVRGVRSTFWRLYVNGGDGAGVELAGGLYPLAARRVHFIPAWVPFSCVCRRPVDHLYVHFDLLGLPGPIARQAFDRPFTLPPNPLAEELCHQLTRPAGQSGTLSQTALAKSAVYMSLSALLEPLETSLLARMTHATDKTGPVWPALRYIEEHLDHDLTTRQLGELCGLSPDHFARRFHQIVGQTPAKYVVERRTARAAQDLVFGEQSIDEIAEQCGFANRFHFTRVFTRQMGLPPSAYRRQTRV